MRMEQVPNIFSQTVVSLMVIYHAKKTQHHLKQTSKLYLSLDRNLGKGSITPKPLQPNQAPPNLLSHFGPWNKRLNTLFLVLNMESQKV